MTIRRALWAAALVTCVVAGYITAQRIEHARHEDRVASLEKRHRQDLAALRSAGEQWADAVARAQGGTVLRAFAAGISPAVLAGRHEGIQIAAVSLLHVAGIAGVHVLALDGTVLYSSDAKLSTTGKGEYRGAWAMQVSELTTRDSTRPGVIDIAVPIVNAGKPLAVAWVEYDVNTVRDTVRPAELAAAGTSAAADPSPADPGVH